MVFESFGKLICGRSSVVERNLAKVDVEGSSPFARFSNPNPKHHASGFFVEFALHKPSQPDVATLFHCVIPLLSPLFESVCVSSRWKVLSGEFRRRPTSLAVKLRKSDRVGRRGLFEPREDFSRLNTYAIPLFDSVAVSVADFSAQNLQLISLPSSQGQQRTHIQAQPASGD